MIDLRQLQQMIATAAPAGDVATVTRNFLQQVERELREGRAAKAQLAAQEQISGFTAGIAGGGA